MRNSLPLCRLGAAILELLAPRHCPVCGEGTGGVCACTRCRLPNRRLIRRQLRVDALGLYLVLFGGPFSGPLRRMVHAYKYREDPFAERLLLRQLRHALPASPGWDALVPVPTHPVRSRERGFSAVEGLTRLLGRQIGLPVENLLRRARYTPSLTGQSAQARRLTLAPAFEARPARGALLLVDDVTTTGATFRTCRRRLLSAGAAGVDLLAVARTPPPSVRDD